MSKAKVKVHFYYKNHSLLLNNHFEIIEPYFVKLREECSDLETFTLQTRRSLEVRG